jgi:hypothetical protein
LPVSQPFTTGNRFFPLLYIFSGTKPTRGKRKIQIQKDRGRLCSRHVTNVQNRSPLVSIKTKTYNKRGTRRGSRDECQKSQPPRFDSNVLFSADFFQDQFFFYLFPCPTPKLDICLASISGKSEVNKTLSVSRPCRRAPTPAASRPPAHIYSRIACHARIRQTPRKH